MEKVSVGMSPESLATQEHSRKSNHQTQEGNIMASPIINLVVMDVVMELTYFPYSHEILRYSQEVDR